MKGTISEVIDALVIARARRHTLRCKVMNFINENTDYKNWRIGDHVDKRLISQAREFLFIDSYTIDIVNMLEAMIQPRHSLRCELIKFIRDNAEKYPDGSTGRLGHQINRRHHLINHCLHRIGDFCDKQLITDATNIFNVIGE